MELDLQKASMWKRISAFLFDFILAGILAVLFGWALSALTGYDGYSRTVTDSYIRYSEQYGVDLRMSREAYEALSPEEAHRADDAIAALNADTAAVRANRMMLQLSVLILSLGIFLAILVWEFVLPLCLGTGQTLGKKIFSIGLMRTEHLCVTPVTLFIRAMLGKYAIETMVPVLILLMMYWGTIGFVGPVILLLLVLIQAGLLLFTRTRSALHDLLAGTVVIDAPSQRIFDTPEEKAAYLARLAAERAAREPG